MTIAAGFDAILTVRCGFALAIALSQSPAVASCIGDENADGVVTIDEVIRSVHGALFGCIDDQTTAVQISLSTDKMIYRKGEIARVAIQLNSASRVQWWSEYPLVPDLEHCVFRVVVSRGHFSEQEVVYDRFEEPDYSACRNFDGGPARVKDLRVTPPAYENIVEIPMSANVGVLAGHVLTPGIYLVEGILSLGRIIDGGSMSAPPHVPPMKAGVLIDIQG